MMHEGSSKYKGENLDDEDGILCLQGGNEGTRL
jgi:hypothetical protein